MGNRLRDTKKVMLQGFKILRWVEETMRKKRIMSELIAL